MFSFLLVLFLLFFVSLFYDTKQASFDKAKMDPIRAILALLIVADHLTFNVDLSWLQPMRKWGAPIVSVFFLISGYGLAKSYISKGASYLTGFFRRRIWKVALPAIVAYVLFLLVCWQPHDWGSEISAWIFAGVPLLPYSWFVEVLILLYFGFWISYKYFPKKIRLFANVLFSIALIVLAILIKYDRCWWVGTLAFPTGLFFAEYEDKIKQYVYCSKWRYVIGFALCICAVGGFYLTGDEYFYTLCYVFIPLAVALVLSCLPLQRMNGALVCFLAGISYEIYLCQGIAMKFFHGKIFNVSNEYLYIVLVYLFVILLAFITKKISTCKILQK